MLRASSSSRRGERRPSLFSFATTSFASFELSALSRLSTPTLTIRPASSPSLPHLPPPRARVRSFSLSLPPSLPPSLRLVHSGDKMAEPSLEEQAKFVRAVGDGTADARQVFTNLIKARAKTRRASQKLGAFALRKGDIVVPNEGDLENLKGVVMSVNTVEGTVSVKHAELPDEQEYDIKHLSRSIQEGEHVKVSVLVSLCVCVCVLRLII
jgi:hypothetical protein